LPLNDACPEPGPGAPIGEDTQELTLSTLG